MEDSSGLRKRKRSTGAIKIARKLSYVEENTGNVPSVNLPHLAVGKILENVNFEDLLQCSLVNKVWNHEARRALREKYECALAVNLDRQSSKAMKRFVEMSLASELPVPYVSLSIKKKYNEQEFMTWWKLRVIGLAGSAIKDFILRAGPYKVVQLDFQCDREFSLEVWLMRNVLAEVLKTVQVLKIKNFGTRQLLFNLEGFPELKKLEVDVEAEISPADVTSLKNLISKSPKLETVGCLSSKWLQLLEKLNPTRKLAVLKEFTCAKMRKYRLEAAQFAALKPKLEKLFVPRRSGRSYAHETILRVSMSLLLSSQASIVELGATYEVLQATHRQEPLASFINLRYLKLDTPHGMDRERMDQNDIIIALFPKLERLEFYEETTNDDDDYSDSGNDWLVEFMDDFPDL